MNQFAHFQNLLKNVSLNALENGKSMRLVNDLTFDYILFPFIEYLAIWLQLNLILHISILIDITQACVKRIEAKGEGDCEPWYFDYWKCIDKCRVPQLFKKLKWIDEFWDTEIQFSGVHPDYYIDEIRLTVLVVLLKF